MAQLYTDDVCAFKADPSIVGTVEYTWRDVDGELIDETDCNVYLHRDIPKEMRQEFFGKLRPFTGYVILAFEQPYDFQCLVREDDLFLVDRALSAGDVVKRQLSDAQSGTVISTSLRCALRPQCSAKEFDAVTSEVTHGVLPKAKAAKRPRAMSGSHHPSEQLTDIPAQELKYCNQYREDDYVIYQDWIGSIKHIVDEVTVRLGNGSVVVVENPDELEEPFWMPGTNSSLLHQRLRCLDYALSSAKETKRPQKLWEAEPCYPGQIVETQKGNLRPGRWKFGAYDPNVVPRGIVAEVRPIEIEISWLYPNMFKPHLRTPPPITLDLDVLESGAVTVYDHSRKPSRTDPSQLAGASYSPDIGFGQRVRFRDIAGAAIKYAATMHGPPHGIFKRIPRAATQGYDLNVFQVVKTNTEVMVQWQDGLITTEKSVSLVPYNNVDEYDVWPGTFVSLKAGEVDHKDADVIICKKIGVIQAADAGERIARVRWFSNPIAAIPRWDSYHTVPPTQFGPISEEVSDVSLYDVVAYPALARSRGDVLIVIPFPLPPIDGVHSSQPSAFKPIVDQAYQTLGEASRASVCQTHARTSARPTHRQTVPDQETSNANTSQISPNNIDWFGEVIDLGLDGNMTIRLGAADEVRDVALPYERVVLVASNDDESTASDDAESEDEASEGLWESDFATDDESVIGPFAMGARVTVAGLHSVVGDSDDEMWSTEEDEEMPDLISPTENVGRSTKGKDDLPDYLSRLSSSDEGMPELLPVSENDEHGRRDDKMPDTFTAPGEDGPHGTLMYRLNRGERETADDPSQPTKRFDRLVDTHRRHRERQIDDQLQKQHDVPLKHLNVDSITHSQSSAHQTRAHLADKETVSKRIDNVCRQLGMRGFNPPHEEASDNNTPPKSPTLSTPSKSSLRNESEQPTMPPRFSILQEPPPNDHPFISTTPRLTGSKMRRIGKEHGIMRSSLPEGVFVRTWEERIDLLRVLIIGPRETPYELAPFLIDFFLGDEFPMLPPKAYFHSWTNGIGRINPNLYEDGKICLSLLGTWPGDNGSDIWSASNSTMLQIIVSLLGLVLVKEPYFNEAGYEVLAGTDESTTSSALYTEKAYVLARGFVQAFFVKDPGGMSDIRHWVYDSKDGPRLLSTVYTEVKALLSEDPQDEEGGAGSSIACWRPTNGRKRLSRGAAILLERMLEWLRSVNG